MTDFAALDQTARQRGMADFERGIPRTQNPHVNNYATGERSAWSEGWDAARELRLVDGHVFYAVERDGKNWICAGGITYAYGAMCSIARAEADMRERGLSMAGRRVMSADRLNTQKNFRMVSGAHVWHVGSES